MMCRHLFWRSVRGLAAVLIVAFAAVPEAVARDYTRSCTAQYNISPTSFRGTGIQRSFTGRGTVGSYMPNTARERARRNIDECLDAHWANRNLGTRPRACTEANQVYNYPFRSLHAEIALAMCNANPGHTSMRIGINVLYDGDKGCLLGRNLWNRQIASNYLINCAARTHEAGTDRPGMDYRNFQTRRWQTCQSRCEAEAQCEAWTFVHPTVPDGPGRCWLKDGVPPPRPNNCCTSGVKIQLH